MGFWLSSRTGGMGQVGKQTKTQQVFDLAVMQVKAVREVYILSSKGGNNIEAGEDQRKYSARGITWQVFGLAAEQEELRVIIQKKESKWGSGRQKLYVKDQKTQRVFGSAVMQVEAISEVKTPGSKRGNDVGAVREVKILGSRGEMTQVEGVSK